MLDDIIKGLTDLFNWYANNGTYKTPQTPDSCELSKNLDNDDDGEVDVLKKFKSQFKLRLEKETNMVSASKKYLTKPCVDDDDSFDSLGPIW